MQPNDGHQNGNWQYKASSGETPNNTQSNYNSVQPEQGEIQKNSQTNSAQNRQPISWSASEFIEHHKDTGWYVTAVAGFMALCIAIFLLTRDWVSIVSIAIVFILFLVISSNRPKQRIYSVDNRGVTVGRSFHPYSAFKSFTVSYEGAIGSINFMPLKRFMPELTIYFAPDDQDKIVEVLLTSLPYDEKKEEGIDRLLRRLRF